MKSMIIIREKICLSGMVQQLYYHDNNLGIAEKMACYKRKQLVITIITTKGSYCIQAFHMITTHPNYLHTDWDMRKMKGSITRGIIL